VNLSKKQIEEEFRRAVEKMKDRGSGAEFMIELLPAEVLTGTDSVFEFARQVRLCSGIGKDKMKEIILEAFAHD